MGPFGVNGEECRGGTHGVPVNYHGEASKASRIRDVGDAGGGSLTRGSGNTVVKRRQATVSQYVELRPLFEVYERETGYKGGGRRCGGSKRRQRNNSFFLSFFWSGHYDQIACSLLGGFSKPRIAATQSLDSFLCSMLSSFPYFPFILTRSAPFRPT